MRQPATLVQLLNEIGKDAGVDDANVASTLKDSVVKADDSHEQLTSKHKALTELNTKIGAQADHHKKELNSTEKRQGQIKDAIAAHEKALADQKKEVEAKLEK